MDTSVLKILVTADVNALLGLRVLTKTKAKHMLEWIDNNPEDFEEISNMSVSEITDHISNLV